MPSSSSGVKSEEEAEKTLTPGGSMHTVQGRLVGVLLALVCLFPPLWAAEQAWRTDGRRISGALTWDKGRLHFTSAKGMEIPFADITRIRFAARTPPPFRIGGGRRVRLRDGQRITGQFLGLDKDTLRLRTAWAARIELPRAAVASLDPLPGWRTVTADNFRDGLGNFTTTGESALTTVENDMEARAMVLREDGQGLAYKLAKVLEAGRVGVNFREQGPASGARWTVGLLFQESERSRRVNVTVAGNDGKYTVDGGGLKGVARDVAKTPGWHRLVVQFTKDSLRITCDDEVLWYNLEHGPGGPLKQVTIGCRKLSDSAAVRGAVAWTEFSLERAVNEYPHPPAESEQDEVRLTSDDQLFGRILTADRRAVQIEGRFGKRALPWSEVAGCVFRRADAPRPKEAPRVRILVRSGLCPEDDVLDGVLTGLDERRLTLRHALLGELTFERGRVPELRPLSGNPR
jgi:hypothetical protein